MQRIALAATLVLVSFTSCQQSEAASVAGTYAIDVDKTVDGILAATPGSDKMPEEQKAEMRKMMAGMFGKMTMTLNSDLTFVGNAEMAMGGETKKSTTKGTWSVDKGTVTMKATHEDGKEKASTQTAKVENGAMTVTMDKEGQKVSIHMKKSS